MQGAYPPGAFGLPPPGVNGDLPGAAGYGAGLHLVSPQMNGAAAAAAAAAAAGYGRSPVVSLQIIRLCTVTVACGASEYKAEKDKKKMGGGGYTWKISILEGELQHCPLSLGIFDNL